MREIKGKLKRYEYSTILLKKMVATDFQLRYQNSLLGYTWSLLKPLALFAILYLVFGRFLNLGASIPDFQVYLLVGVVVWNYFSEVTFGAVTSIVSKGDLIRKINFPKYVIVAASSLSALINLTINFIVIAVFMVFAQVDIGWQALLAPLLLLELFLFGLAVSFFLSALYVRFRDISHIWEVFIQGAFYATPILYPLGTGLIPDYAAKIIILNPVAQIIQDLREVLVTPATTTISDLYGSFWVRLIPILTVLILLLLSSMYFKKHSKEFAEKV